MRCTRTILLLLVAVLWAYAGPAVAGTVKIGVLAKNGAAKAVKKWGATADYLNGKVAGRTFEIVPLDFDDVFPAVENGKVDFFLVNSSMFVTAQVRYGAEAVATMINSRQGKPLKAFGGVIFTSSENDDIDSLSDLRGRTFMAVKESSFGGWQMAYKVLKDAGIDPFDAFDGVEFGGKHDNVVLAVINGAVDAGTVRTDTLERMAAAGEIAMDDVTVLNPQQHPGFPFVCSTPLYPEWPFAKVKGTAADLALEVAAALKAMTPGDKAAKAAKVVGWIDPLDYGPVKTLQKTLEVGAFAK